MYLNTVTFCPGKHLLMRCWYARYVIFDFSCKVRITCHFFQTVIGEIQNDIIFTAICNAPTRINIYLRKFLT